MPKEASSPAKVVRRKVARPQRAASTSKRAAARPVRASRNRTVRKAPTPLQASRSRKKRHYRLTFSVFFVCIVTTAASITLGVREDGILNPERIIQERNERIARGEVIDTDYGARANMTIPVQRDNRPNGGGRGMGDLDAPEPEPQPETNATSTATSTDAGIDDGTASSTSTSTPSGENSTTTAEATETEIAAAS